MTYTLSRHSLELYQDCPRCFWLSVNKKIERPKGPFPSLPSGMDLAIKRYFDTYRKKHLLPPEIHSFDGRLYDGPEFNTWRNNGKGIQWRDEQGNTLRGAIDDLLITPENKLVVLDYKTRGFKVKEDTTHYYEFQLKTYKFLLESTGQKVENYGYLLFYYPDNVRPRGGIAFHKDLRKIPLTTEGIREVFDTALEVLALQKPPRQSDTCGYCSWSSRTAF